MGAVLFSLMATKLKIRWPIISRAVYLKPIYLASSSRYFEKRELKFSNKNTACIKRKPVVLNEQESMISYIY